MNHIATIISLSETIANKREEILQLLNSKKYSFTEIEGIESLAEFNLFDLSSFVLDFRSELDASEAMSDVIDEIDDVTCIISES